MRTKSEIEADINITEENLKALKLELYDYIEAPENNVYKTLNDAKELEYILDSRASEDCEGSYNCGAPTYEQEFIVDGKHYLAKLEVEYNRHDKTYYYIDDTEFTIEEL